MFNVAPLFEPKVGNKWVLLASLNLEVQGLHGLIQLHAFMIHILHTFVLLSFGVKGIGKEVISIRMAIFNVVKRARTFAIDTPLASGGR